MEVATADVLATIVGVLPTDEALALIDRTPGAACLLLLPDGTVHTGTIAVGGTVHNGPQSRQR